MYVCVREKECVCERIWECVCVREKERMCENENVFVWDVCVCERMCVREYVYVYVRKNVYVCERMCVWEKCLWKMRKCNALLKTHFKKQKHTHFRIYCLFLLMSKNPHYHYLSWPQVMTFSVPPFSSLRILCLWVSWKIHQVSLVLMSLELELVPTDRQTHQRFLVVHFCWFNCAPVSSSFKLVFPSVMKNGLSGFTLEIVYLVWHVVFILVLVGALVVMPL